MRTQRLISPRRADDRSFRAFRFVQPAEAAVERDGTNHPAAVPGAVAAIHSGGVVRADIVAAGSEIAQTIRPSRKAATERLATRRTNDIRFTFRPHRRSAGDHVADTIEVLERIQK
jgi:hypothetical protein